MNNLHFVWLRNLAGLLYERIAQFMIKQRKRVLLFVAISLLILTGIMSVNHFDVDDDFVMEEEKDSVTDLTEIIERGYLRATTDYNSTNYFVYRGEPMGFHLELLKHFADHLGVDLEVSVSNDLQQNIARLRTEEGPDLIAQNLTVTNSRRESFEFTVPHSRTRQVLVQRKPERWYSMQSSLVDQHMIRSQLDLAGDTIHVQKGSTYVKRLTHLMEEIGDTIYIVERDQEMEELIEEVAEGAIDYTVGDENLARLYEMYYSNLDARTPVSFEQNLSWAVRPGASDLLNAVNEWLNEFRESREYAAIYEKYYNNPRSVFIAKSDLHSLGGGKISVFDDHFKRYAEIVGWDWRLIASLSYQESRFDPSAVSWAGAFGVMQLMPGTAEFLNVGMEASVREHISAGIRYLHWLDKRLEDEITDDHERIHFVLASYNVGIGHVLDARRLAEKYGKDPNIWKDNVDYYVLNKSNPKYYQDAVVRHGYARGSEPYHYVTEIMQRYHHYKNALAMN
ncbi:MAG: transporter substrate-binding domain-containing protein [Bacteroidales bacterium]